MAVQAIVSYLHVMQVIKQANNISDQTRMILSQVMNQSLLESNLTLHNSLLFNASGQLITLSSNLGSSHIPDLLTSIVLAEMQDLYLARNSEILNEIVSRLTLNIANLQRATSSAKSEINQTLSQAESHVDAVQDVSAEINLAFPTFVNATAAILGDLESTQSVSSSCYVNSACML